MTKTEGRRCRKMKKKTESITERQKARQGGEKTRIICVREKKERKKSKRVSLPWHYKKSKVDTKDRERQSSV